MPAEDPRDGGGRGEAMTPPPGFHRLCAKIFVEGDPGAPDEAIVPIFHDWIRRNALPGVLVDVADYRHVPAGPAVLLVGHDENVVWDRAGGRLGLLVQRKTPLPGGLRDRVAAVIRSAAHAARLLADEEAFGGRLRFDRARCLLIMNDRLAAPNDEVTFERLRPELEAGCVAALGAPVRLRRRPNDPRERLEVLGEV